MNDKSNILPTSVLDREFLDKLMAFVSLKLDTALNYPGGDVSLVFENEALHWFMTQPLVEADPIDITPEEKYWQAAHQRVSSDLGRYCDEHARLAIEWDREDISLQWLEAKNALHAIPTMSCTSKKDIEKFKMLPALNAGYDNLLNLSRDAFQALKEAEKVLNLDREAKNRKSKMAHTVFSTIKNEEQLKAILEEFHADVIERLQAAEGKPLTAQRLLDLLQSSLLELTTLLDQKSLTELADDMHNDRLFLDLCTILGKICTDPKHVGFTRLAASNLEFIARRFFKKLDALLGDYDATKLLSLFTSFIDNLFQFKKDNNEEARQARNILSASLLRQQWLKLGYRLNCKIAGREPDEGCKLIDDIYNLIIIVSCDQGTDESAFMWGYPKSTSYAAEIRRILGYNIQDDWTWIITARAWLIAVLQVYSSRMCARLTQESESRKLWDAASNMLTGQMSLLQVDQFIETSNKAARLSWQETNMQNDSRNKMIEAINKGKVNSILTSLEDAQEALMPEICIGLSLPGDCKRKLTQQEREKLLDKCPYDREAIEVILERMAKRGIKKHEFLIPSSLPMSRAIYPFTEEYFAQYEADRDILHSKENFGIVHEAEISFYCSWTCIFDDMDEYINDELLLTRAGDTLANLQKLHEARCMAEPAFDLQEYKRVFNTFKERLLDLSAAIRKKGQTEKSLAQAVHEELKGEFSSINRGISNLKNTEESHYKILKTIMQGDRYQAITIRDPENKKIVEEVIEEYWQLLKSGEKQRECLTMACNNITDRRVDNGETELAHYKDITTLRNACDRELKAQAERHAANLVEHQLLNTSSTDEE